MPEPFPSVVNMATVGIGSDHADFAVDLEHGKLDSLETLALMFSKCGEKFGVGHAFSAQILVINLAMTNENGRSPIDHSPKSLISQADA